jgi:hypothetical protein
MKPSLIYQWFVENFHPKTYFTLLFISKKSNEKVMKPSLIYQWFAGFHYQHYQHYPIFSIYTENFFEKKKETFFFNFFPIKKKLQEKKSNAGNEIYLTIDI